MRKNSLVITSFAFLIVLIGCKKYPENNLWFRGVNSTIVKHWSLSSYAVDGADSTSVDEMKMYVEKGLDLRDQSLLFPEQYEGTWSLDKKKKNMTINTTNTGNFPTYVTQINIFRGGLTWTIQKLSKSEFWLSTTREGKQCEVHMTQ
jgi:hypothetical protein